MTSSVSVDYMIALYLCHIALCVCFRRFEFRLCNDCVALHFRHYNSRFHSARMSIVFVFFGFVDVLPCCMRVLCL